MQNNNKKNKSRQERLNNVRPGPSLSHQLTEEDQFEAELKLLEELKKVNIQLVRSIVSVEGDVEEKEQISEYLKDTLQIENQLRDLVMIQNLARQHLQREEAEARQRLQAERRERIRVWEQEREKLLEREREQRRHREQERQKVQSVRSQKSQREQERQVDTRVIQRTLTLSIRINSQDLNLSQNRVINLEILANLAEDSNDSESDDSGQKIRISLNLDSECDSECSCERMSNSGRRWGTASNYPSDDTEYPETPQQRRMRNRPNLFFYESENQSEQSSQISRQYSVRYLGRQLVQDQESNSSSSVKTRPYYKQSHSQGSNLPQSSNSEGFYNTASDYLSSPIYSQSQRYSQQSSRYSESSGYYSSSQYLQSSGYQQSSGYYSNDEYYGNSQEYESEVYYLISEQNSSKGTNSKEKQDSDGWDSQQIQDPPSQYYDESERDQWDFRKK